MFTPERLGGNIINALYDNLANLVWGVMNFDFKHLILLMPFAELNINN